MIYDSRFAIWLKRATIALSLLLLTSHLPPSLAQGSLTPPGAPAPTMKSLDQIEPRVPIASAPFTINSPGSYYLTTNVTVVSGDAITISANNVTLDLRGFTISSTQPVASSGSAILISGSPTNIAIANGHISSGVTVNAGVYSGSGFGNGIYCAGSPQNVLVRRISVVGVLNDGIVPGSSLQDSTEVQWCTVDVAGNAGIVAGTVFDSSAINCNFEAVNAFLAHACFGSSYSSAGIDSETAEGCYGFSSTFHGIYTYTAENCYGASGTADGLFAFASAHNCYGVTSTGTAGIALGSGTAENCYGNNGSGPVGVSAYITRNCVGTSANGQGISANIATGCYGRCSSGAGLSVQTAESCYGYCPSGAGISLGGGGSLFGCVAQSSMIGISANDGGTIQNCTVSLCWGDGIRVTNNCQVIGNLCTKNGSGSTTTASIHVLGHNNRIDGNHCIGNLASGGNGIKVEAGRNLIIRNSSKDHNTLDYDIIASDGSGANSYGQIIAVPGNNFVNSNPWANFAF